MSDGLMQDKVSVIVPAYNVGKYIERCVDSLEQQTYQNVEIVIVDDCSSDDTWDICQKLSNKEDNIILIRHNVNQGQEITREDGIAVSTGKWIMFLDADDTYTTDGIELVMKLAEKYDPDWVLCPHEKIINDKHVTCSFSIEQGLYSPEDLSKHIFVDIPLDVLSCIGSKVYKKSFLIKNNLHFDLRYKYNEDGAYTYSCIEASDRILLADIPYYQYWIRTSGSIQTSYRDNMFQTISNADHYLRDILTIFQSFSGGVREGYYMRRAVIMLACLVNEVKFRNYNRYREAVKIVREDSDFLEASAIALTKKGSRGAKTMFICIKYHLKVILYFLLYFKMRVLG
ncbi:MAG: glycosyltransferase family 2 protein [Aeriscardovia sp.]|nr:glycosyltransferase family 2 protein [Aeriscardovia sp.]